MFNRALRAFPAALFLLALAMPAHAVSTTMVISQFQVAGGTAADEFVELHNVSGAPFDLNGHRVVYRSAAGVSDVAIVNWTTSTIIPAGGYYLIAHTAYDGSPAADITFNFGATGSFAAGGGGFAIRNGAVNTGTILDSVGYGTATNAFVETAVETPAPGANNSSVRAANGCTDTDNNQSDFSTLTPAAPRSTATTPVTCGPVLPNLTIDDVSEAETNAGANTYTFTVTLSAPAGPGGVAFDIATADNTATDADNDYEPNSATPPTSVIAAGNTTYTFDVTVNGDANIEPTETFFVNVTNVTGANVVDGQGQGTITNDDSPPTLNIADPTAQAEGNAGTTTMTFTVQLDAPAPPGGVTFDIATADGTATDADNDYEPNSATPPTATIAAGNTTFPFQVTINGDTTFEPNETFTVSVTNITGATPGDTSATGTINNDDAAPTITINDVALVEGNAGTQVMSFTVTLSAAAPGPVTVDFTTNDSSATLADSDYVANSGTVTFTAGDTSEPITVTINGDANIEGDEQFFIDLTNPTGGAIIGDNQALGVIKSDDAFSIAAVDTPYVQDFDTLASSDAANSRSATTPAAWTFLETGSAADVKYRPGNGTTNSGTTGDTYSYGGSGSPDRALGTLLSGSLTSTIGAQYVNNTGTTITTLSIVYTGEQWRLGATGRADRLDFEFSTDATSLSTGTWTAVNQLDFNSPFTSANAGDVGARDGNSAPNRATIAYTITGLNIADGEKVWFRWLDANVAGAEDGLAIDNFSVVANIAGGVLSINDGLVTEGNAGTTTMQFTVTLSQPAGAGGVTFDITTVDGTATVADNDYVANTIVGSASIPAGQTTYTFDVTINGDVTIEPSETFTVEVTNVIGAAASDPTGVGTIANDDFASVTLISDIQTAGNVSDEVGEVHTIIGIVTGIKSGGSGGFFVQEEEADYDADPDTSEGIFVFTGGANPPAVVIGNRVAVTGTVSEFPASAVPHAVTELSTVTVDLQAVGQPLPAAAVITPAEAAPTSNISQYEKYEGMRVTAPSFTVVAPTDGSVDEVNATSTSNGVFYAVVTGTPRPFREPGIEQTLAVPSEAPCAACIPRFDQNPEKLRVDSDNQPGATQLNVTAGQTITNMIGVLDFGFFEYTLLPEAASVPAVAGDSTFDAVPVPLATELTISSINLERFYDTVNDDTNETPGDDIDDEILTPAAFNNRLNKASLAIRNVLRNPDVVGVVEVDNINALTALANKINADNAGATNYVPYLEEGNDIGGIDVGFLVNANRVTVGSVTQIGATATFVDPSDSSVDILNDRPSLVLEGSIQRPDASLYEFVAIVNHLRSLNGVDDDTAGGQRVRAKRAAQAEFLADYVQQRQIADPTERIILVGDFNAFEVSDGYVDMIGTILGTPAPADEVVRSSPDLVNPNLIDLVFELPQDQRYSYNFDGNAQVIDHAIVNDDMYETFTRMAFGRLDADFPETFRGDASHPERISDHDGLVAYFDISTPSQISIGDTSVTEGNAGTATMTFTVTLDTASAGDITVAYATSNGTATAGSDYVAESGTITFVAGDTSETVTIDVNGDTTFEGNQTLIVTLTNNTGNSTIFDATGTGTILDDETALAFVGNNSVPEGNAGTTAVPVEITLNNPAEATITIDYSTSDGVATAGSDYTAASGTVTFLPGDTSETISVDVLGDTTYEADENFVIFISNPSGGYTLGDGVGSVMILNDDPVLISIADNSAVEGNAGTTTLTFTVTLAAAHTETVTVNYMTSDGSAGAPLDYTGESGTVTFLAGDTSEDITIDILGDVMFEPNETFTVTLSAPSANAAISDGSATGTIINDDGVTLINIGDASVPEGNAGTATLSFLVTLTAPAAENVTVDYTTTGSTATPGSDFVSESGTVTFVPGDQSETITIDVNGDTFFEPNETLTVTLSNASVNANIADGTGIGTITNDDAISLINVGDASVAEGNAGTTTLTFTVTLDTPAIAPVTVDFATSNGTATAGSDYVAATGTVTFAPGDQSEPINITVNGDTTFEPNETLTVTLSNPSANASIKDGSATGTINNEDTLSVINIGDASVTEGDAGTVTLTFDVTLDVANGATVTVNYATSDGTAVAGSDYVAASGTLTFVPGDTTEQISITVNGDTFFEANETLTVTLSAPSGNASINDGTATGTINNDDSQSVLITAAMVINPPSPEVGQQFTKTITVSNGGPGTATNVTVTDDLPAGLTLVSVTSSQGTCNAVDPVVCNLGSILANGSATVTITAVAAINGTYTNTAVISSDQTGPAGTTDSETFTVVPAGAGAAQIPTLSEYALFALLAMLGAIAVMKLK